MLVYAPGGVRAAPVESSLIKGRVSEHFAGALASFEGCTAPKGWALWDAARSSLCSHRRETAAVVTWAELFWSLRIGWHQGDLALTHAASAERALPSLSLLSWLGN